jgi:hypothetical protein
MERNKSMKTYKDLMEALAKKWKDVRSSGAKREASKMLKALDRNEVLAYSAEHEEFSKFKDEREFEKAKKGYKGKRMHWLRVERRDSDGEALTEKFNFKGALKTGMLKKNDEKYFRELENKNWEIIDFNLTSKGYELIIKKRNQKKEFSDKTPSKVLKQAAQKAR